MLRDDDRYNPFPTRGRGSDRLANEAIHTIARGEDILDHAKEVARAIDERVHHAMEQDRGGRADERNRPDADRA